MNWPQKSSRSLSFSWLDLNSGGPFPQDVKSTLKPEVRDPHAAVGASLGTLYCKGSSRLPSQPASPSQLQRTH